MKRFPVRYALLFSFTFAFFALTQLLHAQDATITPGENLIVGGIPAIPKSLAETANHVDKIKKPIFVIAGKNDPRVPISESDQIVAALKAQGTPVWSLVAKDEGHGFQKKSNQDYQFYAVVMFLNEHLLK